MASDDQDSPNSKVHRFVDSTLLLQSGLVRYFNKRLFSDITVIAPDGRSIMCHQVVLSAGSKRFANMLEQGNLHGEELPVWGVDSDALEAIIQFFYSGECVLRFPGAVAVLDAATRLDVPVLAAAADGFIQEVLHVTTVTTILGLALQFKMNDLAASCFEYIKSRFEDVAATSDFTSATFQTLSQIISHVSDSQSELALFKAAWCWIIADTNHVNHLENILRMVKVPNISFNELIQLGANGQGNAQLAAAAAAAAAAAGGDQGDGGSLSLSQLQAAAAQGVKGQDAAAAATAAAQPADAGPLPPAVAGALDAAAAAAAAVAAGGDAAAAAADGQQQQGWQGVAVTTCAAPLAGNVAAAEGLELGQQPAADPIAAAAAAGTDDTSLLAALAAGGGLLSPSAGSSLPAGTLNPALTGGYDSSLPTPSSRAPHMEVPAPHGGRYSSNEVHDYAAAAAAAAAYGGMGGYPAQDGDAGFGSDPRRLVSRYNSGHLDDPAAMAAGMGGGATSSGGRSVSPSGSGHMAAHRARAQGAGSGGRSAPKGVCQVEGCYADLKGLRDYHLRYKICEYHLKVSSIVRDGKPQRFCQQCGRFHLLTDFDGNKRSCRARLQRHNARRRKRGEEDAVAFTPSGKRARNASSSQLDDEMLAMSGPGMGASGGMHLGGPDGTAMGAVPGAGWNPMDPAGNAAYMAAMGMPGPGFPPGVAPYGNTAAYGAAIGSDGTATDGSNWFAAGQYAGQMGNMPGMPGMPAGMSGLPDVAGAAASGGAAGQGAARSASGYSGGRRSSRGVPGSRPGSAAGHRKGSVAAAVAAAAAAGGEDTDEDGGNAQMRGWAAGLEMLADVAQLRNHTESEGAEAQGADAAAAAAASAPVKLEGADQQGQPGELQQQQQEAAAQQPDGAGQPEQVQQEEVAAAQQQQEAGQPGMQQQEQLPEALHQQPAAGAVTAPATEAAAPAAGTAAPTADPAAAAAAVAGSGANGSGAPASVAAEAVQQRSPSPAAVGLFAGRSSPPQDAPPTSDSTPAVSSGKALEAGMPSAGLPVRCDDQAYMADASGGAATCSAAAAAAPASVQG